MKKFIFIIFLTALFLIGGFYASRPPKSAPTPSTTNTPSDLPYKLSSIDIFAQNLGGVRDLEFSPGESLLASLTSEGKVIALKNNETKDILAGLNRPHGIAFYNGKLYVAEETKVTRYSWDEQNLKVSFDKVLFDLPKGGNHFTRSLVFDKAGKLYISIGSTCNVCNEEDERYAAVLISDAEGLAPKVFAKGLRNSVFMALNPKIGEIWATEMGRDFLGDNLPPDEINILKEGKDYGWPNCYGDKIPDTNFNPSVTCTNTESPIFKIPAHSAPLGLAFDGQGDLLVAYHGSWNRSVPDGYKVVRMKVEGNQIISSEDFITGFLEGNQAIGRPVDLIFDKAGNLYISDDKAGAVYILRKT